MRDYFVEQINTILGVTENLHEFMKEEHKQIQEQLNSEDNRKKYREYISIINQHNNSADEYQEIYNLQTRLNYSALLNGFNKKIFSTLFCHINISFKSKEN